MITQKIAHRDFGKLENMFADFADDGGEPSHAALARAQEDAAMEAQDVLSQADEALVLG